MSQLDRDKRRLLGLVAGANPTVVPAESWPAIDAMAAQHRLLPLLHYRVRQGRIAAPPDPVAQGWRAAYTEAGFAALVQRGCLRGLAETLDRAGIAHVALKGSALAWDYWPEPALRPMRDIDVLVPRAALFEAADLLLANGFAWYPGEIPPLRSAPLLDKHLPPMIHRDSGTVLELHHALTDVRVGQRELIDPAAMLARARPAGDGSAVRHPAPEDLFAHLAIHAVAVHRFDCGPLVMADCYYLWTKAGVDRRQLAVRAQQEGWARAGALVLALTARWFATLPPPGGFAIVPSEVLAAAEEAVLMDFDQRHLASITGSIAGGGGWRGAWQHLRGSGGGFGPWIGRTARGAARYGAQLANPRARKEALAAARLRHWAEGGGGRFDEQAGDPAHVD